MYQIYHIKGVKIGCTTNPNYRVKSQGFLQYEIIEVHEDVYKASDREIELQKEYGYPVDTIPYWKSREMRIKNTNHKARVKGGEVVGKMNVESGKLDEARKKSNEVRKGTKHSEETKLKMRLAKLGKPSSKKGKKYKV
jgi:hypothetical protein